MAAPLAEELRPRTLDDYIGQDHLLSPGKPIRSMIESQKLGSMILWGPPGSGKTSLARLLAQSVNAEWVALSAVTNTVSDLRSVIAKAAQQQSLFSKETVVFLDEIHRFNKAQQDALLPVVEDGTIIFIGATTENPGFTVNAPLISRSRVFRLVELTDEQLHQVIDRTLTYLSDLVLNQECIDAIIRHAAGDARIVINTLEMLTHQNLTAVSLAQLEDLLQHRVVRYDRSGDGHYDTISAFIKSMRGSDPDATLHYLARMLNAGEDPMFIARRMVIFASEDIGNAQPTALVVATSTMQATNMIGLPEAQLILAQTATYLATARKSIASTVGIGEAAKDVSQGRGGAIPLHLRNAANSVMKNAGYGAGHIRYPWKDQQRDSQDQTTQQYLPDDLVGRRYYRPEEKESS